MSKSPKIKKYQIETHDDGNLGYIYGKNISEAAHNALNKILEHGKKNNQKIRNDYEYILLRNGYYKNFIIKKTKGKYCIKTLLFNYNPSNAQDLIREISVTDDNDNEDSEDEDNEDSDSEDEDNDSEDDNTNYSELTPIKKYIRDHFHISMHKRRICFCYQIECIESLMTIIYSNGSDSVHGFTWNEPEPIVQALNAAIDFYNHPNDKAFIDQTIDERKKGFIKKLKISEFRDYFIERLELYKLFVTDENEFVKFIDDKPDVLINLSKNFCGCCCYRWNFIDDVIIEYFENTKKLHLLNNSLDLKKTFKNNKYIFKMYKANLEV